MRTSGKRPSCSRLAARRGPGRLGGGIGIDSSSVWAIPGSNPTSVGRGIWPRDGASAPAARWSITRAGIESDVLWLMAGLASTHAPASTKVLRSKSRFARAGTSAYLIAQYSPPWVSAVFVKAFASSRADAKACNDPPGRKEDPELKSAVVGHEYIEPLRWKKPNVLILQRHDYYRALRPDKTITDVGRLWEITVTFAADGKPDVKWKRDDRW